MKNNLKEIQKMLLKEMKRLDNIDRMIGGNKQEEISRANALSQNATVFIKTINIGLRVLETANKFDINKDKLIEELGINYEK